MGASAHVPDLRRDPVLRFVAQRHASQHAAAAATRSSPRRKRANAGFTVFRRCLWSNTESALQGAWPALPYEAWKDTYATLHMWTQVVGKVALAQAPPMNHSLGHRAPAHAARACRPARSPTARARSRSSSTSSSISCVIEPPTATRGRWPLAPRSVAEFYRTVMARWTRWVAGTIWSMPVEIPSPVRFEDDTVHHTYDREYVERLWRILVQSSRCSRSADAGSSARPVRPIFSGAASTWR